MATKAQGGNEVLKNSVYWVWNGFTADGDIGGAEDGSTIFILLFELGIDFTPNKWTVAIRRTAGSQDVIDVALQGSMDTVSWVDIATITSVGAVAANSGANPHAYKYVRALVTTVGSGNTLSFFVLGTF